MITITNGPKGSVEIGDFRIAIGITVELGHLPSQLERDLFDVLRRVVNAAHQQAILDLPLEYGGTVTARLGEGK